MYQGFKVALRESKRETKPVALRRQGMIPGVVFGKEFGSVPVKCTEQELRKLASSGENLVEIEVEYKGKELASIEEIKRDPVNHKFIHVSFHIVKAKQVSEFTVPLEMTGNAPGSKAGGVVTQVEHEIDISCLPTNVPKEITVDISTLELNENLTVEDIKFPEGIEFAGDDPTITVIVCKPPKAEKVEEPTETEVAEGEAAAAAAGAEGAAPGGEKKPEGGGQGEKKEK